MLAISLGTEYACQTVNMILIVSLGFSIIPKICFNVRCVLLARRSIKIAISVHLLVLEAFRIAKHTAHRTAPYAPIASLIIYLIRRELTVKTVQVLSRIVSFVTNLETTNVFLAQ